MAEARVIRAEPRRAAAWLPALLAALAWLTALLACAGPAWGQASESRSVQVWVVSHGAHTGIVVPAWLAQAHDWPAARDLPQADFLEVGWGDRAYYPAQQPGWSLGLRALFWPGPSVLQFVALREPPEQAFPMARIRPLLLSQEQARRLAAAIVASHAPAEQGGSSALGPALYGQGYFYPALGRFHLLATCNVWAAARLRDAGLPMWPRLALSAGMLYAQLPEPATLQLQQD